MNFRHINRAARTASAILVASAIAAGLLIFDRQVSTASGTSDQAIVRNCDGTDWSFRAVRLPSGSVGVSYAFTGNERSSKNPDWTPPVDLGGVTASSDDISMACIIGRVWVFARFTTPVDGTARLYERHGFPDDVASGSGAGWTDWYHWR